MKNLRQQRLGSILEKVKARIKERREAVTFCHGLKLKSADGKMRNECRNFQNSIWIPMDDLIIQAIRKESADIKGFPKNWTC